MKVYILLFDDRIESISCDGQKQRELAAAYNGFDEDGINLFGPYEVIEMELEDMPKITKNNP